jgi:hypothetical protein
MFELLLYSSMACPDADALILRIKKHEHMEEQIKIELVETVRESVPECYWGANDWRNGSKPPSISGAPTMNTLQLVKKQINKASALHDAQISHTAYRGVEYNVCDVKSIETHGTYVYRGRTYTKW